MSNTGTLDDLYLEWLYHFIGPVRNRTPDKSHWELAKQLYTTPYRWHVPNDDNRGEDGKGLRYEFLDRIHIRQADPNWMTLDCSVLEMLIALARRLEFEDESGLSVRDWFWRLLKNLGIDMYSDAKYDVAASEDIREAVDRFLDRNYRPNGVGGLFPLVHPIKDQRNVEIWYQMSLYLMEAAYLDNIR